MASIDDVTLLIGGRQFTGWPRLHLERHVDASSVLEFTAPFDASSVAFRKIFQPFSYAPLEVLIGGKRRFLGRQIGIHPDVEADQSVVVVTGYGLPGSLMDCKEPASALPLQFRKLGLRAIATKLIAPFELDLAFKAPEGAPFADVKMAVEDVVIDFLITLAQQRACVMSDTPDGELLFWQSVDPGRSVAKLKDHEQPVTGVHPSFNPQQYFSEITGYTRKKKGKRAAKYTARNTLLPNVLRPTSFRLNDVEKGDAETATKAKLARMFAEAVSVDVDIATWRDPAGDLWDCNTTVKLLAPQAMVYSETEFLVRTATLDATAESRTAQLNLVLPGVFSGKPPTEFPWAA